MIDGWERKGTSSVPDFQQVDINLIKCVTEKRKLDPGKLTEADITPAFRTFFVNELENTNLSN